ncbi:MAG TPA: ComEC/Rec2 family competence protein [Candidatus Margulisiibacteriota bacterium]|nr:ComEC/Rec2 family competence protein [Candidatus Margulisiibacteriota bacterium]
MSRGKPVFILALIFSLGIIIAKAANLPFIFYYIPSLPLFFLLLGSVRKERGFDIFLCGLTLLLGSLWLSSHQVLPACHIGKLLNYKDDVSYAVKGIVMEEPVLGNGWFKFILRVEEIRVKESSYRCCGDILVSLRKGKDISCADELFLSGRLYRALGRWNNPKNEELITMKVDSPVRLSGVYPYKLLLLRRFSVTLKKAIEKIIFQNTSRLSSSVLDAMLLGEKRFIPPLINNYMVRSGTVHILVVSGFNVGIVSFAVILFLKVLRVNRKMRFLLTLPILCLYCLMTGSSNPVVRATVMAVFFILATLFKREADIYNALGLSLFFILALDPYQLFDIGFQLSFTSVISIVYFFPRLRKLLRIERIRLRPLRIILEGCLVSLSAWLGTMGFIAWYFRIFSPVTILANLFIVPLATLITLCGFSLAAANYLFPCLLEPIASTSELAVALMLHINALLVSLPGAYFLL